MKELENLYKELQPKVYAFFYFKTSNEAIAEDLTHDTFYEAVKNYHTFVGNSTLGTWLFGIAKNLLKKHYRRDHYKRNLNDKLINQTVKTTLVDEQIILREKYTTAMTEINRLAPLTREIVLLRLIGELSHREIGELVGKSENYVRVHFHRAKLQLQIVLEGDDE